MSVAVGETKMACDLLNRFQISFPLACRRNRGSVIEDAIRKGNNQQCFFPRWKNHLNVRLMPFNFKADCADEQSSADRNMERGLRSWKNRPKPHVQICVRLIFRVVR